MLTSRRGRRRGRRHALGRCRRGRRRANGAAARLGWGSRGQFTRAWILLLQDRPAAKDHAGRGVSGCQALPFLLLVMVVVMMATSGGAGQLLATRLVLVVRVGSLVDDAKSVGLLDERLLVGLWKQPDARSWLVWFGMLRVKGIRVFGGCLNDYDWLLHNI